MAYSLKKVWSAMAATLVAATGLVSAAQVYNPNGVLDCCDSPCGSVRPALDGCGSWFISADALYWRAAEDGLGYATRFETSLDADSSTVVDIDVFNPKFRWDWGVRVGIGYDFSCGWDIRAYWTHFHTRAHGHQGCETACDANSTLFPVWGSNLGVGSLTFPVTEISARYRLRLDLADFELGRAFCCGPCVELRPHIGVRAVWLDQKYDIRAEAATTVGSGVFTDRRLDRLKSDFEGAGLRAGLDTTWCIGCGFSLYGNAAASIVYGHFHNNIREDNLFFTGTTPSAPFISQSDSYHACRFISDAALGVKWSQGFCCDSVILTLQVGWEHHLFINQNRFEDFFNNNEFFGTGTRVNSGTSQFSRGDLCLHGWTFGARLDF